MKLSVVLAGTVALGLGVNAISQTTLPPDLTARLTEAMGPADIANLVLANPLHASTLMTEAAILGLASPSTVLRLALGPDTDCAFVADLVTAGVLAAPREADVTAAAAFAATKGQQACHLTSIAMGAVDGVEAADLADAERLTEIAEIAVALMAAAPDRQTETAEAIAAATDDPDDGVDTVLALADDGIETADFAPSGELPADPAPALGATSAPSESQDNPSPN